MRSFSALLIGYGNPGRGDDGLGPAFAHRVAARALPSLTVEIDYQLSVEHAWMISQCDLVLFADASLDAEKPYHLTEMQDCQPQNMGSHSVTPEVTVSLARLLFGRAPRAFVLGIAGRNFGSIHEGLSQTALENLSLAEAFFLPWYLEERAMKEGVR
jgi:hydrogenase maturation protease